MINTKNINTDDSNNRDFVKSALSPGNHFLKINQVSLRSESKPEFGVKLMLQMESRVVGGNFKGFQIDPKNPAAGNYLGQIGNISYSRYGMKDFSSNGYEVFRDEEILKAIKTICENLGLMAWWESSDMRFPTIEAFVEGFNSEAPFTNVWAHYCVAGREYMSKDKKHVNHELFLPSNDKVLGKPFHIDESKVQKYFYSKHVIPLGSTGASSPSLPSTEDNKDTSSVVDNFLNEINMPVEQTYHKDNQTDPTKPVIAPVTSQAEANFMNEGKKIETPITDSILNEGKEDSKQDIITGDSSEKLPWED